MPPLLSLGCRFRWFVELLELDFDCLAERREGDQPQELLQLGFQLDAEWKSSHGFLLEVHGELLSVLKTISCHPGRNESRFNREK
jgi:hypothetical protein